MLGGVQDLVRARMKSDGVYNEFKDVLKVCAILCLFGLSANNNDSASTTWCLRM